MKYFYITKGAVVGMLAASVLASHAGGSWTAEFAPDGERDRGPEVRAALGWYESGACKDVLIARNVFRDNLTSAYQFTHGVISICPGKRRDGSILML